MRKLVLIAAILSMLVVAAAPALAHDNKDNNDFNRHDLNDLRHDLNQFDNQFDNGFFDNGLFDNGFFNPFLNDNNNVLPDQQNNAQNVDSGASSQSIVIEGGGDNSNQCVGLQPISNTGSNVSNNAVNGNGDTAIKNGDFVIDPTNNTSCSQNVDQNTTAY